MDSKPRVVIYVNKYGINGVYSDQDVEVVVINADENTIWREAPMQTKYMPDIPAEIALGLLA